MSAPTATRATERTAETNEKRHSRHYEETAEGDIRGRKVKHEKKSKSSTERRERHQKAERVYARAESVEKMSTKTKSERARNASKESPNASESPPETRKLKDRHVEHVDLEEIATEVPDNTSSSETQTLTEGQQSPTAPRKEKLKLPNHSIGKAEQSDLDAERERARLAFMKKCHDYNELAMKTLLDETEEAKMASLVKDIPKNLEILEKLRSLDQHADESFNFFPEEEKDKFKKLNRYLNDHLVLRLGRKQMRGNVDKIATLIGRDNEDVKRIKHDFNKNDIASLRLQCKHIKNFMLAIQSIGNQIKDPNPVHAEKKLKKLPRNLQAIVIEIEKHIPVATQDFKNKLATALNVTYVQGRLESFWLTTSRKVIEVFQRAYPNDPVIFSEVKEKWYTAFWKALIKEPMTNFKRVILGGYLYWNRANAKPEDDPLLAAFVNRGEEFRDQDFNKYVEDSYRVFAEEIFGEEFEVVRDLGQFMGEEALRNLDPEKLPQDLLKMQELIMLYIQSLPPGSNEKKLFIAKLEAKLNGRNKNSVEKMLELLMLFFRIPSQTFLWQATMILKTVLKALYPLEDDHIKTIDDADDQTKVIEISVGDSIFSVNYCRLAKITCSNPEAYYTLTQKFTVNILKPNAPKEIKLTDPLTVEFYCKRMDGLSDQDKKELEFHRKRIDSALAVQGIPPLLMID